jgi:uncharacterized protein YndB with AHSA1/START domain
MTDDPRVLRLERVFDAPPERIFAAWTDPALVGGPAWLDDSRGDNRPARGRPVPPLDARHHGRGALCRW